MSYFYLHDDGYFDGGFSGCLDRAKHFAELVSDEIADAEEELVKANSAVLELYKENLFLKSEIEKLRSLNDSLLKALQNRSDNNSNDYYSGVQGGY